MPFDISNWMALVDDAKKLSELSIPGTHDSGARYIDPTVYELRKSPRLTTQTDGIREQLDSGIRFLDIRVGYTKGKFLLYHENAFENLGFAEVRNICSEFLTAHPRETIILSLKKEDDAPGGDNQKGFTFQDRFNEFVRTSRKDLWYLENAIPTLKDVRGKIVLYRRFVFPVKGNVFRDLIKFVSVYIVSIAANVLALPLLVEVAGLNPLLAQAIILVVTTVLSYVGHKYFSFRRPLEPAASAPETSGEPAPVSSVPETTQD